MAEFPALPLFTDAIIADTGHLDDEEFGVYMRLLMLMWRTPGCSVPNDQAWITKRMGRTAWEKIEPLVKEFCVTIKDRITQKRLQKEFAYLQNQSRAQRARVNKRWKKNADESGCGQNVDNSSKKNKSLKGNENTLYPDDTQFIPPTPPHPTYVRNTINTPVESPREGVSKNLVSGGMGSVFRIADHLDPLSLSAAKGTAGAWDLQALMKTYDQGIASGRRQQPNNPERAFIAWIKKYTKGKPPD